MHLSRNETHRRKVCLELTRLANNKIKIDTTFLQMHQCFKAMDGRKVVVIVPFPEHNNYCLNIDDKKKLERINADELHFLFAKFIDGNFVLTHCVPYVDFNFNNIPKESGDLGDYYFIKESAITGIKYSQNLPLFDGLEPISNEFDGLFT